MYASYNDLLLFVCRFVGLSSRGELKKKQLKNPKKKEIFQCFCHCQEEDQEEAFFAMTARLCVEIRPSNTAVTEAVIAAVCLSCAVFSDRSETSWHLQARKRSVCETAD